MNPAYSSVPAPAAGPRRPVGVVLAAIALGLITLFWFFVGLGSIFQGLFVRLPQVTQYPMMEAVQIATGVVILLLSGLCAWVVVGLFQLKNWARISILIVGGVVAFYSFLMAAMFCAMAFMNLDSFVPAGSPNAPPALMKRVFLGMGGVSFLFVAVGVWWLAYFNLRRVRGLFVRNGSAQWAEPVLPAPVAVASTPVVPAKGRSMIEVLVICLAVLYFWGSASAIVSAFLRVPFFVPGHVLRGAPAAVLMLGLAVFEVWVGIGLLRRVKAAWIGALALNTWSLLYAFTMFAPGSRAAMINYQDEIARNMQFGPPPNPAMNHLLAGPIYGLMTVFMVLMTGAIFWLLFRAKPLFEPKTS